MITVIDSIMGSGKTNFMIKYMKATHTNYLGERFNNETIERPKFLYVAPLLSEVDRITKECPNLNFRDPIPVQGRKLYHLESLVDQGQNICTTHALFKMLTREICRKIRDKGYILVIDEALECVSIYDDLTVADRAILVSDNRIYVEPKTNKVRWNHKENNDYKGKFDKVMNLCDNGNLAMSRQKVMIWEFPTEFLSAFEDVFVLTYLFSGSLMASYLKAEGLEYELMTLSDTKELVPCSDDAVSRRKKGKLRKLITVYEGPLNRHGNRVGKANPFSSTWFTKQDGTTLSKIKASTEHFFKSVAKTQANDNAWTTFTKAKSALRGGRYRKGFIPCNAKATNDYRHKRSLAYLCNIFHQPPIVAYFQERGIDVDQDAFALSEMVQWVWRSQIREEKPITLYIPSQRMRALFLSWLNDEDAPEHTQNRPQSPKATSERASTYAAAGQA